MSIPFELKKRSKPVASMPLQAFESYRQENKDNMARLLKCIDIDIELEDGDTIVFKAPFNTHLTEVEIRAFIIVYMDLHNV